MRSRQSVLKDPKKTEQLAAGFVGNRDERQPVLERSGLPVDTATDGFAECPGSAPGQTHPGQHRDGALVSAPQHAAGRLSRLPPPRLAGCPPGSGQAQGRRSDGPRHDHRSGTTGEVVVTFPEATTESSLALVPPKADLPELGIGSEHYFNVATVKIGEKTVKVSGVPAGKYRAIRGTDEAEVEVVKPASRRR